MFFGQVITQSTPYSFNPETVSEDAGEVLSITNVVLAPSSKVSFYFIFRKADHCGSRKIIKNF
jgi:hypothetical protein